MIEIIKKYNIEKANSTINIVKFSEESGCYIWTPYFCYLGSCLEGNTLYFSESRRTFFIKYKDGNIEFKIKGSKLTQNKFHELYKKIGDYEKLIEFLLL